VVQIALGVWSLWESRETTVAMGILPCVIFPFLITREKVEAFATDEGFV
jgi:hypothetical protein